MKKVTIILALLFISNGVFSQFNQDAPWMKQFNMEARNASNNAITFQEIVDAFNAYWEGKDPFVKGSGYKPFKRWENYWKNFVKEDGTLPTQTELWDAWVQAKQNQSRNAQLVDNSNWVPVGPFEHTNTGSWSSGQGRINSVIVDPNNPNTYYVGAPAGGIWKSTDTGTTWQPLSDFLPQIGVSGIAIDYNNSDIIYIATGDDDASDSYSVGVMKSIDGGQTWNNTGLNPGNSPSSMNDIYIHPTNSNILWVATNNGVFKTINGGTNWTNVQSGNIKDIKIHPTNPNILYAVSPTTFYKSVNGGDSFLPASPAAGLPTGTARLVIDVTPANPSVVYVLAARSDYSFDGVYKSTNEGITFSTQSTSTGIGNIFEGSQAWFDMAFAVSDTDEDEVYSGVLNVWKSTNGGVDFTKINSWSAPFSPSYTHADIHILRFFNGQLFAGTDGGIYKSTNGGANFSDLTSGIQNGQFYRIAVSRQTTDNMMGGLQDNGGYAYSNSLWQNYYGADGMDTAIDPSNSNIYFGFTQVGGNLYVSTTAGASSDFSIGRPSGENGNWVTPLVMNSESELYSGYNSLYRLCGSKWEQISTSFGDRIDKIEIDDLNPDNIYIAINNTLYKSTDRGFNFNPVETFSTDVTSVEVNNNDSDIVYVTTSGFNGRVERSIDGGFTFSNITGSLPTGTKNVIKHQSLHSANPLFVGTSLGVYRYDDILGDWEEFDNNLPITSVTDLEINTYEGTLVAATYGRGIWKTSIQEESLNVEVGLKNIIGLDNAMVCGDVSEFQVEIINKGNSNLTTASIEHIVNGVSEITNWSGDLAPGSTEIVNISRLISSSSELKEVLVFVSSSGDSYESNGKLTKRFNNNLSGDFNIVNTFESTQDELIVYDGFDLTCGYWERGIPTGAVLNAAASGTMVYGTQLTGQHDNNVKSYLVSRCYDLTMVSNPVLRFNMAFNLETDWDIVYVEYSLDSGESWDILGTANDINWYNSDTTEGENNTCYNCPGAQWTGTSPFMQQYSYSLASFTNEDSFMIRFVFHSDQAVTEEGAIIDDLVIEGTLSTNDFTENSFVVYPNPSSGVFTLTFNALEELHYNLYDVTGKELLRRVNINTQNLNYDLDLSSFPSGVYFLQVFSQQGSITKKLIKQ